MTVGVGLRFWVEYLRSSVDDGELSLPVGSTLVVDPEVL